MASPTQFWLRATPSRKSWSAKSGITQMATAIGAR